MMAIPHLIELYGNNGIVSNLALGYCWRLESLSLSSASNLALGYCWRGLSLFCLLTSIYYHASTDGATRQAHMQGQGLVVIGCTLYAKVHREPVSAAEKGHVPAASLPRLIRAVGPSTSL